MFGNKPMIPGWELLPDELKENLRSFRLACELAHQANPRDGYWSHRLGVLEKAQKAIESGPPKHPGVEPEVLYHHFENVLNRTGVASPDWMELDSKTRGAWGAISSSVMWNNFQVYDEDTTRKYNGLLKLLQDNNGGSVDVGSENRRLAIQLMRFFNWE